MYIWSRFSAHFCHTFPGCRVLYSPRASKTSCATLLLFGRNKSDVEGISGAPTRGWRVSTPAAESVCDTFSCCLIYSSIQVWARNWIFLLKDESWENISSWVQMCAISCHPEYERCFVWQFLLLSGGFCVNWRLGFSGLSIVSWPDFHACRSRNSARRHKVRFFEPLLQIENFWDILLERDFSSS